ncbi:MAG: DNA repair exonuclease [archaeon]
MSVQILQCGDLHLDRNFNMSNLSRDQQRKEDLNSNFSEAVDYAIKNKPDIFLITGDVFDRVSPGNAARILLTDRIRTVKEAGISVFMIGGNHDVPKIGKQPLAIEILSSAGLATVFSRSEEFESRIINVNGKHVCVAGKSYFTQIESENPLRGHKIPLEGDYNILMIHGSLQGLNVVPSVPEMASQNPFRPRDIKPGLNYLALGHFHNHFEREHEDCRIVNCGSLERLSWAEINDEKGFTWAELNKSNSSTEFIKLQTRPMEGYTLHLSKDEPAPAQLSEHVINYIKERRGPAKIARLSLQGRISQEQYRELKVNQIIEATRDDLFHLTLDRSELEVEGFGRVFLGRIENPVEAFTRRLEELIARASTSDEERRRLEQVKLLGRKYLEELQA